jgi:protein-S-isoprenylcysteine O-methyltransferase Ste14
MTLDLRQLAFFPWWVFLIYWIVSASRLKQVKTEEASNDRLLHIGIMVVAFCFLFRGDFGFGVLDTRFVSYAPAVQYAGIALTWLGIAFAVWARYSIGANWSGRVTLKVDHQLIQSGPYAFVRHPIYSGLLLANAGAALFIGKWRCVVALGIFLVEMSRKALKEEKLMLSEFGDRYAEYRRHSGFLIPGL